MGPNSANISAVVGPYKNEPFFNDNQAHSVEIIYTPGVCPVCLSSCTLHADACALHTRMQTLSIEVDKALEPMIVSLDLDQLIGIQSGVFVGFTGSTMGVGETQEILSWSYVYRARHPLSSPLCSSPALILGPCNLLLPFLLPVGNTYAVNCVAYGPELDTAVAGEVAEFTIQAVDQFGFNVTTGGDIFTVTINATSDPNAAPGELSYHLTG